MQLRLIALAVTVLLIAGLSAVIYTQNLVIDLKDKDIKALKKNLTETIAAVEACDQQQKINYEASDAFQKENAAIRRDNTRLKRLLNNVPDQCIPIQQPPGRSDAEAPGRLSGTGGVMAPALIDLATSCEEIGAQLRALQDWVEKRNRK